MEKIADKVYKLNVDSNVYFLDLKEKIVIDTPFSNFNMNFPISIGGRSYNCNEQYIQSEKAKLFDNAESFKNIMSSTDPREMKRLGRQVKGYIDAKWKEHSHTTIMDCVRRKIYDYGKMQELLLATGNKTIGEGTPDMHFGVGLHISDPRVLNADEWKGKNIMGTALMEVRSEIQMLNSCLINTSCNPELTGDDILTSSPLGELSPGLLNNTSLTNDLLAGLESMTNPLLNDLNPKKLAVMLGDSNAKGMVLDDTNFEVEMVCRAGGSLIDVPDMLEECKSDPQKVEDVLVHLGSYNWSLSATDIEDHQVVYRDYIEALNEISTKFPRANIHVSSIPTRNPVGLNAARINKINGEITLLNEQLQQLAAEEENIIFIDHSPILSIEQNPIPDLYKDLDLTGIQLTNIGMTTVANNISRHLNDLFNESFNQAKWVTKI